MLPFASGNAIDYFYELSGAICSKGVLIKIGHLN